MKDKTEAITELEVLKNVKTLKLFLGSIHHLSKFMKILSRKTDRMRRLLKNGTSWEWTTGMNEDFENLKKEITEAQCLAQFYPEKDNYVTTDRQGATL